MVCCFPVDPIHLLCLALCLSLKFASTSHSPLGAVQSAQGVNMSKAPLEPWPPLGITHTIVFWYLFFVRVCVAYVNVCMLGQMQVPACVHMCTRVCPRGRDQRRTSGILLSHSLPCSLEAEPFTNPELGWQSAGSNDPSTSDPHRCAQPPTAFSGSAGI